ncbi:hypothetical protein [uncultured Maribacter sp.]|uniref:hypothetical protein n=1 Tax=uncultured Maribacter sp. TaxID=431308 RepID=UPI00261FD200|nr:hypothetical protein [uncultured Maribacter sp.]
MKSIVLLTALFFTCFFAQAQANNENVFLEIETAQIELVHTIEINDINVATMETENTIEVARLHKHKNHRAIRALEFITKLNDAKLS